VNLVRGHNLDPTPPETGFIGPPTRFQGFLCADRCVRENYPRSVGLAYDPAVSQPPRPTHADGLVHGVVVGCRDDHDRWLVIRRSAHVAAPGQVCFPGGAKEHGESEEQTAVREAREELGLEVELIERVWDWRCPDRPLRLFGYFARVVGGDLRPDPREVAEAMWLARQEITTHPDMMTGTELLVTELEAAHRAHAARPAQADHGSGRMR